MYCHIHSQGMAKGACVHCGKLFCADCLVEVDGKFFCKEHVKLLFQNTGGGYRYTGPPDPPNPYEEKPYDERYCGPPMPAVYVHDYAIYGFSPYNRVLALLLCLFFGVAGFHRFYVRKIGTGVLWLLTGGMFGIGWILDLIAILCGYYRDAYGRRLR
ncbi:MAG: NINE protein [Defluviitaleaceae bacterium]|nr:NINE protein [Defluviitaleaceae bacterium]MCL2835979.1 NINE protein [Defluviitaleaceae bacterium]